MTTKAKINDHSEEWLLQDHFHNTRFDSLITVLYTHPHDYLSRKTQLHQIIEICKKTFPHIYQESLERIWYQDEADFTDWIFDAIDYEMPNPDALEYQEDQWEYINYIPYLAYGFEWGHPGDILEEAPILSNPVLNQLVSDIFSTTHKLDNFETLDEQEEFYLNTEDDEDEDTPTPYRNGFTAQFSKDYHALGRLSGILYKVCKELCESLYQQSIKAENLGYSHIANLLHYLFTKMGPAFFIHSHYNCQNQVYLDWDAENFATVCHDQYHADQLYASCEVACEVLKQNPMLYDALINNYRMVGLSLRSEQKERGDEPQILTISSTEFIRGIDIKDQFPGQNIYSIHQIQWPPLVSKSYLTDFQQQQENYSPYRLSIGEQIIKP